jgi:hypothetical protein
VAFFFCFLRASVVRTRLRPRFGCASAALRLAARRGAHDSKGTHDTLNIIFLEEPYTGDAGRARIQATLGILQGYATQGQYRHGSRPAIRSLAGLPQLIQAARIALSIFFEHRTKYRKVGAVSFRLCHLLG